MKSKTFTLISLSLKMRPWRDFRVVNTVIVVYLATPLCLPLFYVFTSFMHFNIHHRHFVSHCLWNLTCACDCEADIDGAPPNPPKPPKPGTPIPPPWKIFKVNLNFYKMRVIKYFLYLLYWVKSYLHLNYFLLHLEATYNVYLILY